MKENKEALLKFAEETRELTSVYKLPEPKTYPYVSGPQCEHRLKPSSKRRRCKRVSRYSIHGHKLCEQHAGEHCLDWMLNH